MRKFISIILGILLIAGAVLVYKKLDASKKTKKTTTKTRHKIVVTQNVSTASIPIQITTSGILKAKQKIDLSSEVQGVLLSGGKSFKAGTLFYKGETILRINSDEHQANLRALKSKFYSALTAIMPDLQLDFPSEYNKWKAYLARFDMQKPLEKLPKTATDKEKYFITGRNILSSYYSVKNLEVRLSKYTIRAPFSGVLADALVNPGSLISPGQKLGEFINTAVYELEVTINSKYSELLEKGKKVNLYNLDHSKSWSGIVSRINPKIDVNTQSIKVYIELRDKTLKEGMYLEATLAGKTVSDAFELQRSLLVDEKNVYVVNDSVLALTPIKPIFFNEKTVVVQGLENGQKILKNPVPGAYNGMLVKVQSEVIENKK